MRRLQIVHVGIVRLCPWKQRPSFPQRYVKNDAQQGYLVDRLVDTIGSTLRTALLTAVREQLGEDPIRRPVLVTHFMSLRRVLENAPSPDQGIISDVKYRALISAQTEALFVELYDKGRD
jgi:hypothetical protein